MTIITCDHCGPTRVAPHDVRCPNYEGETYPHHFDYGQDDTPPAHKGEDFAQIGYASHGTSGGDYLHYQPLRDRWPDEGPPLPSPIVFKATHQTVAGLEGTPECVCGYDPRRKHPEATPGQLFAYVGQHIREQRP
jgi:hypothetical protein